VRLPPSVHGEGDRGFVSNLISIARAKGVAAFVGVRKLNFDILNKLCKTTCLMW